VKKARLIIFRLGAEVKSERLLSQKSFLHSLKTGDLGVFKTNPTKELEEVCSGVERKSLA
jgi:hypothetical protein